MEDRSYRRNRALATPLAHVRGFPANEIECALISMMARSIVKRSTDTSDTLVQDPTSPAERLSPCNTPPVHTWGRVGVETGCAGLLAIPCAPCRLRDPNAALSSKPKPI